MYILTYVFLIYLFIIIYLLRVYVWEGRSGGGGVCVFVGWVFMWVCKCSGSICTFSAHIHVSACLNTAVYVYVLM